MEHRLAALEALVANQAAELARQGVEFARRVAVQATELARVREEQAAELARVQGQAAEQIAELTQLREELSPFLEERRAVERLRHNFISALIVTAQHGFGYDVDPFLGLSRETWGEEILWDAVKDLPHGRARREGPSGRDATEPFGLDFGPCSLKRTRLMFAAQKSDASRLRWLLARGAKLEAKGLAGQHGTLWASRMGRLDAACAGSQGGRCSERRRHVSAYCQPGRPLGGCAGAACAGRRGGRCDE